MDMVLLSHLFDHTSLQAAFSPWLLERKSHLCLYNDFHVQGLWWPIRGPDCLSKKFTVIFWLCLLTPLFSNERRSKRKNFSPILLEASNLTVRKCGCLLMPYWSPSSYRWIALKLPGTGTAPRSQPDGWWSKRLCPCPTTMFTCRKQESFSACGLASQAANGFVVSLQGQDVLAFVYSELIWGSPQILNLSSIQI